MKTTLFVLFFFIILGFYSCEQDSEKVESNPFDLFCNTLPNGWICQVYQDTFDTLPIPEGKNGRLENPIAIIKYTNDSLYCSKSKPLYLQVYDISKKDTLEKIIASSQIYSWCIPMFFGENENYYLITSPCYLYNGCWTDDNLNPLFQSLKGLFTKSIIKDENNSGLENGFEIYLTEKPYTDNLETDYSTVDFDTISLLDEPILRYDDLISYDTLNINTLIIKYESKTF